MGIQYWAAPDGSMSSAALAHILDARETAMHGVRRAMTCLRLHVTVRQHEGVLQEATKNVLAEAVQLCVDRLEAGLSCERQLYAAHSAGRQQAAAQLA